MSLQIDTARVKPAEKVALWLMLVLTFVTGLVDAVGYLGLDKVFVGNMTGNVVILGMAVSGADGLPVLGPAIALVAFTLGAYATGLYLRGRNGWSARVSGLLVASGILICTLAVILALVDAHTSTPVQIGAATATAAVMGVQACVARKIAVADVTTVVVTSTLVLLAAESWTKGRPFHVFNRRAAAVFVIFAGALVGAALLVFLHMSIAMALAGGLTLVVAAVGHRLLHETSETRSD